MNDIDRDEHRRGAPLVCVAQRNKTSGARKPRVPARDAYWRKVIDDVVCRCFETLGGCERRCDDDDDCANVADEDDEGARGR